MNIRDIKLNASHPDPLRRNGIGESGKANGVAVNGKSQKLIEHDRVEISHAARSAAYQAPAPEIDFGKKALLGIPPLSEERVAEILERVREGFYSQPDALNVIVERLSSDLLGP
jgi:hypothetical protein